VIRRPEAGQSVPKEEIANKDNQLYVKMAAPQLFGLLYIILLYR